jgi:hypothetical protein
LLPEAEVTKLSLEGSELLGSKVPREDVPLDIDSGFNAECQAVRVPLHRGIILLKNGG